jgi:AcrR family transcriptional regulator
MGIYHQAMFERIAETKRRTILDAAAAEFARAGFAAANINRIAEIAEVSVGSLYKYFGSKENCFLAVLEEGFRELETTLGEVLERTDPPLAKIESILRLIPRHSRQHQSVVRLYNELTGEGLTPAVAEFCHRFETLSARAYTQLVHEIQAAQAARAAAPAAVRGRLGSADAADPIDPAVAAYCLDNLFMMLQFGYACDYFALRRRLYLGEPAADNDEYVVNQTLRFIRGGLGL